MNSKALRIQKIMANTSFQITSLKQRVLLIAVAIFIVIWLIFAIKWSLANSMSTQSQFKEISQFAIDWSPNDPQPYYSLAALNEKSLSPNDLAEAVSNYEKAVALSPNNYLLWSSLATARDRNDDSVGAEKAIRKALELAPNYSEVRWILGNILLRNEKSEEGFVEIRKAAETNPKFVYPTASTALQIFDGDLNKITQNIGQSDQINSALAVILAKKERFDDALTLSKRLKILSLDDGNNLISAFLVGKKFRAASEVQSRITQQENNKPSLAKFVNSSFENDVNPANANIFDWQLTDALQPQIGVDDKQKQDGNRSIVIVFNSTDGKDFRQISQTISVESNKKYSFQTFARSELKASSTLKWEVLDASDSRLLGSTSAISAGSDWQKLTAEFTSGATTEGVIVRLVRVSCGSSICPISGKVWFDNFSLQ
jgi:tetratricopeptide (TPR) repeat protein